MATDTTTAAERITELAGTAHDAIRALTAALEGASVERSSLPDLGPLRAELSNADLAAMRAGERHDIEAAGMVDEPSWRDLGAPYAATEVAWAPEVVRDDERYPTVIISAPNAPEANRRAVAWAEHERRLPSPIPVDGARERLAGRGTREITPGRWQVEIEGW